MSVENKKIMIFGGTGSLGRSLIRRLVEKNHLSLFSRDEGNIGPLKMNLGLKICITQLVIFGIKSGKRGSAKFYLKLFL